MLNSPNTHRPYLLASDFDQTLSFNDSGQVLCDILGIKDFSQRVQQLSALHMVQQGGELAYLLLHDPDFSKLRVEHLRAVGREIRLKANIDRLYKILNQGIGEHQFEFYVISAAPEEIIQSALEGIVPPENIYATRFEYHPETGAIMGVHRVAAGFGKVAALNEIKAKRRISQDHVIYVGDGSSDIHVMLDVNHHRGLTIAVSESRNIAQIARRTVLSDDTLSILIPILEELFRCTPAEIIEFLDSHDLAIQDWNRGRTDWIKFYSEDVRAKNYGELSI